MLWCLYILFIFSAPSTAGLSSEQELHHAQEQALPKQLCHCKCVLRDMRWKEHVLGPFGD